MHKKEKLLINRQLKTNKMDLLQWHLSTTTKKTRKSDNSSLNADKQRNSIIYSTLNLIQVNEENNFKKQKTENRVLVGYFEIR